MTAYTINLDPILKLNKEQFYELCAANPDLKLERNANGELVIMSPTGGETSAWNADINLDLGMWNRQQRSGKVFDSSGGFSLPQGSERSPDAAWIPLEKWNALSPEQRKKFLPLCPDFAIELLSPTDSWIKGLAKMQEYQDNGCRLGWLIDPESKRVAIYRLGQTPEILNAPASLSGEEVLQGFVLNLEPIWSAS
ncbi:MAG: Uma2 family endonuclease [Woronichinia naegeliana WA131]|jgi:Uma2 family endonuclease|uniref:Uma2 family endonuclease n=1 Tax=Woronichinia naegeliana WA131 TaxID=2824559 RepID=A0A977KVK2_9CYAN|nr:MAG: Uma2 family endonuclease [Woronichinia naegeliana WA131]